jgi:glycyl-tRNA synthetase beta chain
MLRLPRARQRQLTNRFILVSNIEASDGGKEIVARQRQGGARPSFRRALFLEDRPGALPDLRRLKASAEKFGLDLAKPLDQRMAKLDHLGVTFHAKLGTQGERVATHRPAGRGTGAEGRRDPALATRAAMLAKADLTTEVVGEFPELQGVMGRIYAGLQGEDASVALAAEEHYKPQGPSDTCRPIRWPVAWRWPTSSTR